MKQFPLKIILACAVAVILVGGSVVIIYRQSQTAYTAGGALSASQEEWLTPINMAPFEAGTNQTDVLSKQVFSNFIVLNQSGKLNDQTVKSLAEQLSSEIIDRTPKAKVYTSADLRIISNPTKEDIKNYGNEFFLIRTKYQNAYIRSITALDSPILDATDSGTINTYLLMSEIYQKISEDLLKLAVPTELTSIHLEILNNYSGSAYGLKQLKLLDSDPVATVAGLNLYSKNSDVEELLIEKMARYFKENGIIFFKSDSGYGWNNI